MYLAALTGAGRPLAFAAFAFDLAPSGCVAFDGPLSEIALPSTSAVAFDGPLGEIALPSTFAPTSGSPVKSALALPSSGLGIALERGLPEAEAR